MLFFNLFMNVKCDTCAWFYNVNLFINVLGFGFIMFIYLWTYLDFDTFISIENTYHNFY